MVILLLCTITAAIYLRATFFPFCILDDSEYVSQNAHVMGGLSFHSIKWAFTTFHASNWHPVTWLSLMTDSQLFGTNPMGYHTINVVIHVITTALIYLLFNSMTGTLWRSAFIAALFALHPLHVESVAWISERKDVLSTMFLMITLLCYTAYVKRTGRGMYQLALAAFALGLMAKSMLVTTPVLLLLLDYWPLHRFGFPPSLQAEASETGKVNYMDFRKLLLEKLPFMVLAMLSSVITIYAQNRSNAIMSLKGLPVPERIGNALVAYEVYLRKMLLPFDLALYYPLTPATVGEVCFAAVLLSGMLIFAFRKRVGYPYLVFGALWYIITLAPVIGLIQVGEQAMADRYTYIPLVGLFVVASWGAADLASRYPGLRKPLFGAGVLAVGCCAVATSVQLAYWKDNVTLFTHTIAVTTENFRAHYCLGMAYSNVGRPDLAVKEFKNALKINPDEPYSRRNLALSLQKIGNMEEAIAEYREFLAQYPDDPLSHNDLGMALLQQGHFDEAIHQFSEALRLDPSFGQARSNLQFTMSLKVKTSY